MTVVAVFDGVLVAGVRAGSARVGCAAGWVGVSHGPRFAGFSLGGGGGAFGFGHGGLVVQ